MGSNKWGQIFTFDISGWSDKALEPWPGSYGLNLRERFII